jgi:hypothetical protein
VRRTQVSKGAKSAWLWELRGESGEIPHLAKNERDVGHPALAAGLESKSFAAPFSSSDMDRRPIDILVSTNPLQSFGYHPLRAALTGLGALAVKDPQQMIAAL